MRILSIFILAGVVALDQTLKNLTNAAKLHGSLGLLQFTRLHNHGATMGILQGDSGLLIAVAVVVVGILIGMWIRVKAASTWFYVGWALLLGGTVGNLIDRVIHGYVTDMLQVPFYPAVFNVADIAIRSGIVLLLIHYILVARYTSARKVLPNSSPRPK